MALLKNIVTNEIIALQPKHLFGQAQHWVDTYLDLPQHCPVLAAIRFIAPSWQLEQLGNQSNGLLYNGSPVNLGGSAQLQLGGLIDFIPSKQQPWRIINLDPPKSILRSLHSADLFIELNQTVNLPQIGEPKLLLKPLGNGIWGYQKGQVTATLQDGSIICADDEIWQFSSNAVAPTTMPAPQYLTTKAARYCCIFRVSKDEEHVSIEVATNTKTLNLGERVHHYPLLLLARTRREDMAKGYDELSQGWVDIEVFKRRLLMDSTVLNMQIYRARKQLTELLTTELHGVLPVGKEIVERRPGQLRFGFKDFEIYKGSEREN